MLSVPEEFAGQMMKCPLCDGTFPTPSLPGAPLGGFGGPQKSAQTPPTSPMLPETYSLEPAPAPPAPKPPATPNRTPPMDVPDTFSTSPPAAPIRKKDRIPRDGVENVAARRKPSEPVVPGEYKRTFTVRLDLGVLTWLPPALLTVLFLLSFFPWETYDTASYNLWECAFSRPHVRFLLYLLLFLLAWLVSLASVVFGAGLAPEPPFLQTLGPWRHAISGGLSLLAFLFLAIAYLEWVFMMPSPMTVWMRIAVRVQFFAVLFALLELWLDSRRKRNMPPPYVELRW
jgi:hypothetical protein